MTIFSIDPDTGAKLTAHPLTPEQGVRIAASVLPGIQPEVIRALLRASTAPTPPDPGDAEERITAYLELCQPDTEDHIDSAHPIDSAYPIGAQPVDLTVSDLRDVLAELIAWRALAADRMGVIEALREDLAFEQDHAEQGDPITAADD